MKSDYFHPDEESLMLLLKETLPDSDLASVPESVLQEFVCHALYLWENSPYCQGITPEQFLHFVFYPRINTEDLTACRKFFFQQLYERVSGLDAEHAILAVNQWCAENVTYQASDDRTENPMTAFFSGTGRCGEESVFTVTALRSIGIPARQVYVPYWTHCDDNHAWVEAWANGRWNYLGACEPEPVLNRGWFTEAATRAPMVFYRTFFDCSDDPLIMTQGCVRCYSVLEHYTRQHSLSVSVPGHPNADIRLEVMNMAALRQIAGGKTDANGFYSICVGSGTFHIEACDNSLWGFTDVTIDSENVSAVISLEPMHTLSYEADFLAPASTQKNRTELTPDQDDEKKQMLTNCTMLRGEKVRQRMSALGKHNLPEAWMEKALQAGENAKEIIKLYFSCPVQKHDIALQMLNVISVKDLKDTACDVFLHHLNAASLYCSKEGFTDYILNPRIDAEKIGTWRDIPSYLSVNPNANDDPKQIWKYLTEKFNERSEKVYPDIITPPEYIHMQKTASQESLAAAFVAIMRSLGIPARISPTGRIPEYYQDKQWNSVGAERNAALDLVCDPRVFSYGLNFSLSFWTGNHFAVVREIDSTHLPLTVGYYRLVTSHRLPNGNQLCSVHIISLAANEKQSVKLSLRHAKPQDMLSHYRLNPFTLLDNHHQKIPSSQLLKQKSLILFLDPCSEPTEHVINELIAEIENCKNIQLIAVLKSGSDALCPQIVKLKDSFPEMIVCFDEAASHDLARSMFSEPDVYPFILLTDQNHIGFYGSCGYNVGSVPLALQLSSLL